MPLHFIFLNIAGLYGCYDPVVNEDTAFNYRVGNRTGKVVTPIPGGGEDIDAGLWGIITKCMDLSSEKSYSFRVAINGTLLIVTDTATRRVVKYNGKVIHDEVANISWVVIPNGGDITVEIPEASSGKAAIAFINSDIMGELLDYYGYEPHDEVTAGNDVYKIGWIASRDSEIIIR